MKLRILSIDGGGIRGIIPAVILEYIENKLIELSQNPSNRLSDYIDFGVGTSTGSIIVAMAMTPNKINRPKFKMSDIVNAYYTLGENVFKKDFKRNLITIWGMFDPKYSNKYIEEQFNTIYENYKIKDLLKPCAFTSYDIDKRIPVIYTNRDKKEKYAEYYIKNVVRSSTSIPAYFQPAYFKTNNSINTMVDGGIFANNPAMVGYIEAIKTDSIKEKFKKINPKNTIILSLGTGKSNLTHYSFSKVKHWGVAKWFIPILNILLHGMSEITNHEMRIVFNEEGALTNYIRLNPPIIKGNSSATDSSLKNIKNLHQDAIDYIKENKYTLDYIALQLLKQGRS